MDANDPQLEAAEQILAQHHVEVPPGARVRVAAALTRPTPLITWPYAAAAMAVAAVVLAIRLPALVGPGAPAAITAPLAAERPAHLAAGPARAVGPAQVAVGPGSRAEVDEIGPRTALRMWQGDLQISVPVLRAEQSVVVLTRQAKIQALGAMTCLGAGCPAPAFTVRADDDATFVEVTEGEVWVNTDGRGPPRRVVAGRRLRVGRPVPPPLAAAPVGTPPEAPVGTLPEAPPVPPRHAPRPRAASTAQADLRTARDLLTRDADKAAALAQGVIDARPHGDVELQALLVLADAHRRAFRRAAATEAYLRILQHPGRGPFEEEARFQLAILYRDLGRAELAVLQLAAAHRDHPGGPLAPERAALWAALLLQRGDAAAAAEVLEQAPSGGWSRALAERRVEVSQALLHDDPARAAALVAPIMSERRAGDLARAAEAIQRQARLSEGRPASR